MRAGSCLELVMAEPPVGTVLVHRGVSTREPSMRSDRERGGANDVAPTNSPERHPERLHAFSPAWQRPDRAKCRAASGFRATKKPALAGSCLSIGGGVCPRTKLALVQRTAIPRPSNQQCAVVRQDFEVPLHSAIRKVLISAGTRRRSFPRAWRVVDLASLVLLALNARHRQREETQCQRRYVFERSGGSWTQIDKLQPPTLVANARYGARSVVSDRYLMLSSRNASNRNTVQVCVSAATASSSAHRSARKAATPPRVPSTSTTASAAAGPSPRRRRSRRRGGPIRRSPRCRPTQPRRRCPVHGSGIRLFRWLPCWFLGRFGPEKGPRKDKRMLRVPSQARAVRSGPSGSAVEDSIDRFVRPYRTGHPCRTGARAPGDRRRPDAAEDVALLSGAGAPDGRVSPLPRNRRARRRAGACGAGFRGPGPAYPRDLRSHAVPP